MGNPPRQPSLPPPYPARGSSLTPAAPSSSIRRSGDQAIRGFRQDGLSINLSVMATDDGQRIFVQEAGGELFQIPLSPGQTNVSAELPAHFADSAALSFRVD